MEQSPFDLFDAEAARIERFYASLPEPEWRAPTRCAGWSRKDLLAHLCAIEDYTRAGLDDTVDEYIAQAGPDAAGYERLNDVLVARRAGMTPRELLEEWRAKVAEIHPRLRERGTEGTVATSVGPYPAGRQAYYLASELAVHADDAGVPEAGAERAARQRWRSAFAVEALAESAGQVTVNAEDDGTFTVRRADAEARLSAQELVEAAAGRLLGDRLPEPLRRALVVLA